jgi:hypothetical protein
VKVRGDLWRPGTTGVPDDVCDRALHTSLLDVEKERRFLWLEDIQQTVTLVADSNEVALPAAYRSLSSVQPIETNGQMLDALSVTSIGRIRVLASSTAALGFPTGYALSEGKIYLDSKLRAGQKLELIGTVETPDDITAAIAGALTNVTLQKHQAIVIAGACAYVAGTYLKNEAEEARQRRAFDRGMERLNEREDDQRGDSYGGLAVPDTHYMDMAGR